MLRRAYVWVLALLVTWVKLPPTTTVSPTTAMAHTVPSRTCGVKSTGLADTTAGWAGSATAGVAPARTAGISSRAAANKRRRIGQLLGSGPLCPDKGIREDHPINERGAPGMRSAGVHHEVRRAFHVLPQRRVVRLRQVQRVHRVAHVQQPGVPLRRADPERGVPHPQAGDGRGRPG